MLKNRYLIFGIVFSFAMLALQIPASAMTTALSKNSTGLNSAECKLVKPFDRELDDGASGSVGFYRSDNYIPSLGSRKGLVIHVDFPDAPANAKQIAIWKRGQIPKAEKIFRVSSFDKFNLKIDSSSQVYRLREASFYNLNIDHDAPDHSAAKSRELALDALRAADADYDFSSYDFVVIGTPKSSKIKLQGTVGGPEAKFDGKSFSNIILAPLDAITENADAYKKTWLAHNIGHVLGLMHGFIPDYTQRTKPPAWDIMWNFAIQDDFIGWNKWKLDWLTDSQIICLDASVSSPAKFQLSPMGKKTSDAKMIVIKLDATSALVVEVRRRTALDKITKSDEGVIVYKVDTTKGANQGAFRMLSNLKKQKQVPSGLVAILGTMKPGQSVTTNGFKISVEASKTKSDLVKITKQP